MKRKFVKVMFFGALALSTVTYVGCKDYDDDIDNLQTQIDANKASIADLQAKVNGGDWVKSVDEITGGFRITFNNQKTYDIVSGAKGETGAEGPAGPIGPAGPEGSSSKVTIDATTGEWLIDGNKTGWYASVYSPYIADGTNGDKGYWYYWDAKANDGKGSYVKGDKAQGEQGESVVGENGKSPFIGDDGYWYFYQPDNEEATAEGWVQGPTSDSGIYIVQNENRPSWTLHVRNDKGTWETVVLPTADNLTSIKGVSISSDGVISTDGTAEVSLYYGVITANDGVKFGPKGKEVTYAKGTYLTSSSAVINAMVNPVDIDLDQYTITLEDSHGNAVFALSPAEKNMSAKPLTRAEEEKKWNKGIYNMTVSFAKGVGADQLKDNAAYAFSTKNAWGKTILSNYDVKVKAENQSDDLTDNLKKDVDYKLSAELDKLFADELVKVAAYYYEVDADDLKEIGATFNEATNTISAPTKQGSVPVKVHYLKTDGQIAAVDYTVNFTYSTGDDITITAPVVWTLTKDAATKNTATLTVNSGDDLFAILDKEYTGKVHSTVELASIGFAAGEEITVNGKKVKYEKTSITLTATPEAIKDKNGKVTGYKITFTFDPTTVAAVMHNAVLNVINPDATSDLNDKVIKKVNMKVEVKNAGIFAFVPLSAYFTSSNTAIAYGTPNKDASIVNQDLYALFDVISDADKAHITFAEEVPNFGTTEKPVLGEEWLATPDNSEIAVPLYKAEKNDGVYSTRSLTIAYQPFGNARLATISKAFNLTVRSAIKEGSHPDIADKNAKVLSIKDAEKSFKIAPKDFTVKDVKDVAVVIAKASRDARVTNVTIELSTEIAKYAEIADKTDSPVSFEDELTVQLKATTVSIVSEVKGYALVKITDTWGAVTEVKCPIVMKADGAK